MGYGEITRVILERPGIKGLKLVPYGGILYLRNVNKAKQKFKKGSLSSVTKSKNII